MRIWSGAWTGCSATVLGRGRVRGDWDCCAAGDAHRPGSGRGAGRVRRQRRLGLGRIRLGGLWIWRRRPDEQATVRDGDGHRRHQAGDGPGRRQRRTLYLFEKDQPGQSACSGACCCTSSTSSSGAQGGQRRQGLVAGHDQPQRWRHGHLQRHPLYYYSGDNGAGQKNGQGVDAFGAAWFVIAPTGSKVEQV